MTNNIWHAMKVSQILQVLDTTAEQGLSREEVQKRLTEYGYNELKKEKGISAIQLFINQFKNILIIILLLAVVLSVLVGEFVDAMIIGIIIVFSALLGFIQEFRAEKAIEALKKMLSPTITVIRDGVQQEVDSKELVPGDILFLEAGDKVPADARIVESNSLRCDEAALTGESISVGKITEPLEPDALVNDRKNMVFTGTVVTYGRGLAAVTSTGMNTEFGKIAEEVTSIKQETTPLEKRTSEIGRSLGLISLLICILVIGISIIREAIVATINLQFIVTIVMFGVALAVAAVPEALAAIVTGALSIGMHQMAKQNALVRKMPAVETLGCTTVICSDKTGTITKGEMTVRKIFVSDNFINITGAGYNPAGEFITEKKYDSEKDEAFQLLLKASVLCNDSNFFENNEKWNITGDSTEAALLVIGTKAGWDIQEMRMKNRRIAEIPFSSERKRMTTIHQAEGGKKIAFIKGGPEIVLQKCSFIQKGNEVKKLTNEEKTHLLNINENMARQALRVLGLGWRELDINHSSDENLIEQDMVFLGFVGMMDPPRQEAIEAIKVCQQVHIKPVMITGDHQLTALAIAKEIGIYKEGDMTLTGEALSKISDNEFEKMVDKVSVYARVSPMDKLKIVNAWKKRGDVVAMTGDGVNDAPALKHADIGIAMGITGTEVTKEAADMVLSDDNFATIVKAIERGRWIYDNIKKYLTYLLRCNITEVVVIAGVVMVMGPELLPLLPAAILYINLATDGLPALALGIAPPDPDIMQRPPRDPKEWLLGGVPLS